MAMNNQIKMSKHLQHHRQFLVGDFFTPDMPKTQILPTCCVGLSIYIILLPRAELNYY